MVGVGRRRVPERAGIEVTACAAKSSGWCIRAAPVFMDVNAVLGAGGQTLDCDDYLYRWQYPAADLDKNGSTRNPGARSTGDVGVRFQDSGSAAAAHCAQSHEGAQETSQT